MSKAGRKRATRTVVFYFLLLIVVALLWMYRSSIWLGAIVFLNALTEALDSGMGR